MSTILSDLKWQVATGADVRSLDESLIRRPLSVGLGEIVYDLIHCMANDLNSSSFREEVTLRAMGLTQSPDKLGYDAVEGAVEVKPQNFRGGTRLNGGGNFTDFSWKRHDKYFRDTVTMVTSGFHYGRLLYVLSFPYDYVSERIRTQLTRRFPTGDITGQWLRSASFSFVHYHTRNPCSDQLRVEYVDPTLATYEKTMTRDLYRYLTENSNV